MIVSHLLYNPLDACLTFEKLETSNRALSIGFIDFLSLIRLVIYFSLALNNLDSRFPSDLIIDGGLRLVELTLSILA